MRRIWIEIRAFIFLLTIILTVFALDIGCVVWYNFHVNNFIEKQSPVVHADAGIIFFGDYEDDGKALGPDSRNRAKVAINLYKKNKIGHVVCVGGYDYRHWKNQPHLMKLYLLAHGVPGNDIIYDSLSFNTITNWQEAKKIIYRERFDTVIAISAPLHVYRIANMIKRKHVFYSSYSTHFECLRDYWIFYKDVHHEWVSMFLSFALRDEVRNQIVYFVRTVMNEFGKVF